jgi:hypothetical protein
MVEKTPKFIMFIEMVELMKLQGETFVGLDQREIFVMFNKMIELMDLMREISVTCNKIRT